VTDEPSAEGEHPIVKLVNAILLSSVKKGADAICIRRGGAAAEVEFASRGGPFEHELAPPLRLFDAIVRRLAVMASLPYRRHDEVARGTIHLVVAGERHYRWEIEVGGQGDTTAVVLRRHLE